MVLAFFQTALPRSTCTYTSTTMTIPQRMRPGTMELKTPSSQGWVRRKYDFRGTTMYADGTLLDICHFCSEVCKRTKNQCWGNKSIPDNGSNCWGRMALFRRFVAIVLIISLFKFVSIAFHFFLFLQGTLPGVRAEAVLSAPLSCSPAGEPNMKEIGISAT